MSNQENTKLRKIRYCYLHNIEKRDKPNGGNDGEQNKLRNL